MYETLDRHPEIEMAKPMRPEPKFFLNSDLVNKGYQHYLDSFFSKDSKAVLFGEKSTSYIESVEAARAIKKLIPEVKIVIILRNPVYRAISNYFFTKKHGLETRTLTEVFLEGKELDVDVSKFSVSPFLYLERGRYINYLRSYFDYFEADNIKLLLQEEVILTPDLHFTNLFDWLGVNNDFKPEALNNIVNSVARTEEISSEVLSSLYGYYREWNQLLSEEYSLDLKKWND